MAEGGEGAGGEGAPGESGPPAPPRDLGSSAAAFVLALLPRLYVAIAWAREPVWDGHYYDFGARRIAAGLGYSDDILLGGRPVWHPWCHYPVGYSGFLGIVYRLFGHGSSVGPIANAITGALLVVVVHRLARLATTPWRARMAAALAALSPGLILYAALLMTEPLAALGIVSAPWLLARDLDRRPLRGALLAGVALGLTTLVRPQSVLCAPALGLVVLARGGSRWRAAIPGAAKAAGVALAAALVVVAPWTIRNCRVMDGCAFVSTNGGWNLAIGAFPRATGRFETLRATDGCPIARGQVQQDRCWTEEGLRWIREDPGHWLRLMPRKLGFTFDHESFPIGYLGEADPAAWPEDRRALGRGVLSTAHRALLAAAALGLVAMPGRRRPRREQIGQIAALVVVAALVLNGALADDHPFWPLAIAIPLLAALPLPGRPEVGGILGYLAFAVASVAVTHAVFFGEDRYHMVVTPALCILAASALRRSAPRGTAPPGDPPGGPAPAATLLSPAPPPAR
jgi:4-amino-4-deoxy-L-arabinose transferase-like glycosyltransferase